MIRSLAALTLFLLALMATSAGAEVWGVKSQGPVSNPPSTLFRFVAGAYSQGPEIRLEDAPLDVDGLARLSGRPLQGFQITASPLSSRLISIDTSTGAAQVNGPALEGREIRGAAFTSTGRLLVLDAVANELLEIDELTGVPIGSPVGLRLLGAAFDVSNITDLVEIAGGSLILVDLNSFYALDPVTGSLTTLHLDTATAPDGFAVAHAGLCWGSDLTGGAPRLGAYEVNSGDDVFAYDIGAGYGRSLVQSGVVAHYNAGRGDMASVPPGATDVSTWTEAAAPAPSIRAQPNPSRQRGGIAFVLPAAARAEITVHDASGRTVRRVAAARYDAGRHELQWDGRDDSGRSVRTGIYFYRLRVDGTRPSTCDAKVVWLP